MTTKPRELLARELRRHIGAHADIVANDLLASPALDVIVAERVEAARHEVKVLVEEWFTDVSLDDLFAAKGWSTRAAGNTCASAEECLDPDTCPNPTLCLSEGCDCVELCSMGPTCPGGMLAGLAGSGCFRTERRSTDG